MREVAQICAFFQMVAASITDRSCKNLTNGDTLIQLDQWTAQLPGDEKQQWIREYFRHPGGSVVAWADGHVAPISEAKARDARDVMVRQYGSAHGVKLLWYSTPY